MDYELRVQWILKIEKLQKYFVNYISLKLFHDLYFEEFRTDDQSLLQQIREILKKRINQSNFHDFYKVIKKIGKGNFASVNTYSTLLF